MTCEEVLAEIRATALPLLILMVMAAGIIVTGLIADIRRDKICADCADCQRKINGVPNLPPPSSGVTSK